MTTESPLLVRRLVARGIDFVVLGAAGGAVGHAVGFGVGWLALTALGTYAYFVAADALIGRTIGKALLGLRVSGERGEKPSWRSAFARELFVVFGAIPFIGPLLALGAWIGIAITARRNGGQGWHDRLAHTRCRSASTSSP